MSYDAATVVEAFEMASEENRISALRQGQVVNLPGEGELWMTGDLHDHRRNFEKLVKAVDLRGNPGRHVVLHELIHGDHYDADGSEGSWVTLYKAADLKCDFPEQVHFMLANHDLAQIHGEGILKGGVSVCEAFTKGIQASFGDDWNSVNIAVTEFLLSMPLAVRAPNGVFCCHSLPTDQQIETFDFSVFDRELQSADYARRTGAVYQLIWGRHMTPATAAAFAEKVGASVLLTGHQPQEMGFALNGPQHLILASDHNHGVFLPLRLDEAYTAEQLVKKLRKFVAIA